MTPQPLPLQMWGVSGSALATETGHIILMSNDIRKIPNAIRLAKHTQRKVIENIFFSIVIKAAVLVVSIAGYPMIWVAVLADVLSCLLVTFNSMLLLSHSHEHAVKESLGLAGDEKNDACCSKKGTCNRTSPSKSFLDKKVPERSSCCKKSLSTSRVCKKEECRDIEGQVVGCLGVGCSDEASSSQQPAELAFSCHWTPATEEEKLSHEVLKGKAEESCCSTARVGMASREAGSCCRSSIKGVCQMRRNSIDVNVSEIITE